MRSLLAQRVEEEKEFAEFPDEIDVDENGLKARERFARYRGLESFRTSPWHPKENLPRDYGMSYFVFQYIV